MTRKILWLRISYWTGAILDVLAGLTMLFPALFAWNYGLADFHPGVDYQYAMGMGAPLMFGWTVLLLWADRKPLERRGVLLITLFPVVFGMIVNEVLGIQSGFLALPDVIPTWIIQTALVLLFLFSYFNARESS